MHEVTIQTGAELAELLTATREPYLRVLQKRALSSEYLRQARFIIDEFARFCHGQGAAHPWQLRQRYLLRRAALRSEQPFSASYLDNHGRQLRYFLSWYQTRVAEKEIALGQLTDAQLEAYWSTQQGALPYRHKILSIHLRCLLLFVQRPDVELSSDLNDLLADYFEARRGALYGQGYGLVLRHRADVITRRHLIYLQRQGHLPAGTVDKKDRPSPQGNRGMVTSRARVSMMPGERDKGQKEALAQYCTARVEPDLPAGLYRPLVEYLEHLVYERELVQSSITSILRTNVALCRLLSHQRARCFDRLHVQQLDEVVSSLVSAPCDDLPRRRRQVRQRHSDLRGFLRYLQRRGLVNRDLAAALISPPCYRASTPAVVLSEKQVQTLLESVDTDSARGQRCHAVLLLMSTYGLRPVDISRLRLEALRWRQQQIALVQSKTRRPLALPLLHAVARSLQAYLRQSRMPGSEHREVFLSLYWPHRPVSPRAVSSLVKQAMRQAGFAWASARHLRASVATHLLRQGEALSTIQEVLGHCTAETTQRYAVTDPQLLRQVLPEEEKR